MGHAFIALSIVSSLVLAQCLKIAENKQQNVLRVLVWNYLAAALLGFASWKLSASNPIPPVIPLWLWLLTSLLAIIFISNLFVYSRSIHRVGMGISFAAMRVSLIIPIVISLFLFDEHLSGVQWVGMAGTYIALLLLLPRGEAQQKKTGRVKHAWLPILIFIMTGVADSGMKVFAELFSDSISESLFLTGIFMLAFFAGVLRLGITGKIRIAPQEISLGIITGIANFGATVFLILALQRIPGSIVFPVVNVSLVVLGCITGVLFWRDVLSPRQWIGIATAIFALLLLV